MALHLVWVQLQTSGQCDSDVCAPFPLHHERTADRVLFNQTQNLRSALVRHTTLPFAVVDEPEETALYALNVGKPWKLSIIWGR